MRVLLVIVAASGFMGCECPIDLPLPDPGMGEGGEPPCGGLEYGYTCLDGEDNDCDGDMDMADSDCVGVRCDPSTPLLCNDGDWTTTDVCTADWWCDAEPTWPGLRFCAADRTEECAGCSEWVSAQETCVVVDGVAATWSDADGDGVPQYDQRVEGWETLVDNCQEAANADQSDADGDGVGDACDQN